MVTEDRIARTKTTRVAEVLADGDLWESGSMREILGDVDWLNADQSMVSNVVNALRFTHGISPRSTGRAKHFHALAEIAKQERELFPITHYDIARQVGCSTGYVTSLAGAYRSVKFVQSYATRRATVAVAPVTPPAPQPQVDATALMSKARAVIADLTAALESSSLQVTSLTQGKEALQSTVSFLEATVADLRKTTSDQQEIIDFQRDEIDTLNRNLNSAKQHLRFLENHHFVDTSK